MGKMGPKLLFLGTAGDIYTMSKQHLASGGFLLASGNYVFHIDPGPSTLNALKTNNINVRAITAILASSDSLLRSHDVPVIIASMTYDGLDKKGILIQNKDIHFSSRVTDQVERVIYITPEEKNGVTKVGLGDIDIVALPTINSNAIGFKFIIPNMIVSYTSDTGFSEKLIDYYQGSDALILNVPSTDLSANALSTNDAKKIISEVKPKVAIITGIGIKMLGKDILNEIRNIQKESGIQTFLAKDGLQMNLSEYVK